MKQVFLSLMGFLIAVSSVAQQKSEKQQTNKTAAVANFTKLLEQKGTLTYTLKGTGTKKEGKRTDVLESLGMSQGDMYYDCRLVLKSDYTGTFTFTISPSEQAKACQKVHIKRNGPNQRHSEYIKDFYDKVLAKYSNVEGKWSIVDGEIHFAERTLNNDFIIIDNDTIIWDLFEPSQLNRVK